MGIKFLCPNGHKLHVKSFLQGKKAICPKRGARVVVPAKSQSTPVEESEEDSSDDLLAPERESPSASLAGETGSEQHAIPSVAPAELADPFVEAPTAAWYVRPATGGQFGPASAEIMRAWIGEGRVWASSLVWRAGWSDWRAAASVFPQLGTQLPSPGILAPVQPVLPVGASVADSKGTPGDPGLLSLENASRSMTAVPALSPAVRKRRKDNEKNLIASIVLAMVSLVLVVILIWVWQKQPTDEPENEPTLPAEKAS